MNPYLAITTIVLALDWLTAIRSRRRMEALSKAAKRSHGQA